MKTATFPSLRVSPELRDAAEHVLRDGESLSSFVESSIRSQIERRETRKAFIERGLKARNEAERTGDYISIDDMLKELDDLRAAHETKSGA